jgi:hypothetical protein
LRIASLSDSIYLISCKYREMSLQYRIAVSASINLWQTRCVGISGTRYVDIAHVLSEVELIDLSNLMSDYSFLICTQSVPNIDSQSLY